MAVNPAFNKRQKEKARQEHQREKALKRQQRRTEKPDKDSNPDGVDPDIAGIVPGPQPTEDEDATTEDNADQ